jgi:hypothetical protein
MPDPLDIRRRRESALSQRDAAEQDEANYLLEALQNGASLITDDAANRAQSARESARLRGDNVDGSVLPPIGGQQAPLPETFGDELVGRLGEGDAPAAMDLLRADSDRLDAGRSAVPRGGPTAPAPFAAAPPQRRRPSPFNPSLMNQIVPGSDGRMPLPETEDWDSYGNTPGASELADAQSRRGADARALRAMQRETGEETTARLRREWGERGLLGRSLDQEMPPVTIPGIGVEYSPAAVMQGSLDALTLGHSDELQARADAGRYGGNLETHRSRRDTEASDLRSENPYSYATGMLGQMPAMIAGSVRTAGLAPTAARAMMVGEAATTAGLAAHGASSAPLDSPQRGIDARQGAALGTMLGIGGQVAGEVAQRVIPYAQRAATSLDEWAAPRRTRGSVGTGLEAMRRIDDLPGGIQEFAGDLNRYGISPRGSVHTVDAARQRAQGAWNQSNRQLDDVFGRMDLEEQADDVVARFARHEPSATAPTMRPGARASDSGYRSPAVPADAPRGRVDLEPVAGVLDDLADRNARLPGQGPVVEGARELAGEYRQYGGRRTFREAQDLVEALDEPARWSANTAPVGSRLPAVSSRARELRRGVRGAQQAAVDAVDPEIGRVYADARRQNQVGRIVTRRGEDMALREANNRQISPSDYIAGLQGFSGPGGGIVEGTRNILFNRLLRGREATLGAAGAERIADLLRARSSRLPANPTTRPLALRLAGALSADRPEAAQPQAATSAPEPLELSAEEEALLGDVAPDSNEPTQLSAEEEALLFGE